MAAVVELTVSGLVWEGNIERLLKGTSHLIGESFGGGHVVLFAEDPSFKGITRLLTKQFFNAMTFNGSFCEISTYKPPWRQS